MDRYSVSRTKRSLFYIIMAFLTIGLIIAECVLPSERSQIASDENIRKELWDNCGTQFDPQISKMFVDMLDNGMVVIDENNKSVHGYQDNADIESAADKFISEVMKTMSSQEKALYYVKQNCKGTYYFYEQLLADNMENPNLSVDIRNVAKLYYELCDSDDFKPQYEYIRMTDDK